MKLDPLAAMPFVSHQGGRAHQRGGSGRSHGLAFYHFPVEENVSVVKECRVLVAGGKPVRPEGSLLLKRAGQ